MFFRANPGMTSLPCSCKDIYSRNASEELLHEDNCYDRYGRLGYTNILYGIKEQDMIKSPENGFSKVYSQLKLHEAKPPIFEFLEMLPWRACTTLRHPHKTCAVISEKLDILENPKCENPKCENQMQRRSVSTLEARVGPKKKGKPDGSVRPYSDSKLNENSRKATNVTFHNSRNSKNPLEKNYKFNHFKDFSRYISEYTETVTLPRLQVHYRVQNRRNENARAMSTRQQWVTHNALRSRRIDRDAREVPATNSELVSRDARKHTSCEQGRDETYYNVHFPSFESCSFKVARCCVHAESKKERKARMYKDNREKGEGSEIIDDKIQMLCDRLSTTNCGKDDKKRVHRKMSKVLQKSKMRKLEIVTRTPNLTPRNKKPSPASTIQPTRWQEYTKFSRRFPSPRIMCRTPLVTKPAQFQEKVTGKKAATKTTAEQSTNVAEKTDRD